MAQRDLPDGLLDAVKLRLDITWTDPATDNKITELIRDGIAYLDGKYGATADYTVSGPPRTLLFEYVRYARDAALDVFETNYQSYLLAMQNERRVAAYVASTAQDTGE